MNTGIILLAAASVIFSLWRADHAMQDQKHLAWLNTTQEQELSGLRQTLEGQAALRAVVDQIDQQTRSIHAQLDTQRAQITHTQRVLKKFDEQTLAYISGFIPEHVGVHYERPVTLNPLRYRAGAILSANRLPSAGTTASDHK